MELVIVATTADKEIDSYDDIKEIEKSMAKTKCVDSIMINNFILLNK